MPKNIPTVPSVLSAKGGHPVTSERVPFQKVQITEQDITREDGHVDATQLVRLLNTVQDNHEDATRASRSDPTLMKRIVQQVALTGTSGAPVQSEPIYHGLGRAFTGYRDTRAYAGSAPWSVVEAANNGGQDPTQYLVLLSSCTGTYDIEIFAG